LANASLAVLARKKVPQLSGGRNDHIGLYRKMSPPV